MNSSNKSLPLASNTRTTSKMRRPITDSSSSLPQIRSSRIFDKGNSKMHRKSLFQRAPSLPTCPNMALKPFLTWIDVQRLKSAHPFLMSFRKPTPKASLTSHMHHPHPLLQTCLKLPSFVDYSSHFQISKAIYQAKHH